MSERANVVNDESMSTRLVLLMASDVDDDDVVVDAADDDDASIDVTRIMLRRTMDAVGQRMMVCGC